jgi:hypothetical protein
MITMLQELGIEAYYVLVKTNTYDRSDVLPSIYFDHVIVGYELDGNTYYTDLTTDFYPYYVLPEMDQGAVALAIKDSASAFRLPHDKIDPVKNRVECTTKVSLSEDGHADITYKVLYKGVEAGNIRELNASIDQSEWESILYSLIGNESYQNFHVKSFSFDSIRQISPPLHGTYHVFAGNFLKEVLNLRVFQVPFLSNLGYSPALAVNKRHNDLNLDELFSTAPHHERVEITLPKGHRLVRLPEDKKLISPFGEYSVAFSQSGDTLVVEKSVSFFTAVIPHESFDDFKEFYEKIANFDNQLIPIK